MTDFVVYHNQDTQDGPPGRSRNPRRDRAFRIGTAKANPERLLDHTKVWVVSGRGTPRRWSLHYWFIPTGFEPSPRGTSVYGERGASAPSRDGLPLDNFDWFKRLYVDRKLFSFGLQSLASKEGLLLANEFEKLANDWEERGSSAAGPSTGLPDSAQRRGGKGASRKTSKTVKTSRDAAEPLTMNIKAKWFSAIVAGTKRIEYRSRSPFWIRRIEPLSAPFKLRLLNGMTPPVPEAIVEVTRVTTDRAGREYRLHLGEVLKVRNWSRRRQQPRL